MSKIKFNGNLSNRIFSYFALSKISIQVIWHRLIGKPLNSAWPATFEMGVLFWRHQFKVAFLRPNIQGGRVYFDSLITNVDEDFSVESLASKANEPKGEWHIIKDIKSDMTILYLHGGGYAFNSEISKNFARMLAGLLEIKLFALAYRLTPEHPHPAQLDDAIAAYKFLISNGTNPKKIVLIGDSAGGHLTLMLIQALKQSKLPQPALAICISPWTDIKQRGKSFYENDKYDLVQGYMAIKFGKWLQGGTKYTHQSLSPIYHDFSNLCPIYIQAGGKEVMVDMIREFASKLEQQNVDLTLDVWPQMIHNFQFHGNSHPDSKDAFIQMSKAIKNIT